MSLNKTLVPIPMDGAINNKIAEKLLPQGQFLDLQNVVRRKTGQYHKRYGFSSLSLFDIEGNSITTGRGLDRFKRDLLLFTDSSLLSYTPTRNRWIGKGTVVPMSTASSPIVRNNDGQRYADIAYLNGLEVCVWEDTRGGVRYTVSDTATATTIVDDVQVASAGVFPRVLALTSCFIITYLDSGSTLKCRRVAVGQPDVLGTANTLASDVANTAFYDIERFNDVALVMYNTSTDLMLGYIISTGEIGSSGGNGYPDPVTVSSTNYPAGAIVSDEEGLRAYVLAGDTDDLYAWAYAQDLVELDEKLLVTAPAHGGNITAVLEGTGQFRWFAEREQTNSWRHSINSGRVSFDGTNLVEEEADAFFMLSTGIVSKAFRTNDRTFLTVAYQSDLQSTYFVVDQTAAIVSKMATSTSAGMNYTTSGRRSLAHVIQSSDDFVVPLSVRNRLTTQTSTTASDFVGVDRFAFNFSRTNLDSSELGKNLHFAGGVLSMYDGQRAVEHGFFLYPENITCVGTTGGSLASSKPYRVRLVFEWVDGQGQVHRSAPSLPVSVSTGGSDTAIEVELPAFYLTAKDRIKVVAYRTKADEVTVYYRAGEAFNDVGDGVTTFTLTDSDATISTKEILYTVGGTLDNIVAPSPVALTTHRNRTWLISAEDNSVWYSREHVEGEGVCFSDGQRIKFDNGTAIGSLDSRLALFTDSSIDVISGSGPLDSGQQNDFTVPENVSCDVGCIDYRSMVEGPFGIMFKSRKGIYLLDPSLKPIYIGAPVEDYNDLTVSSAVLIEDDNEVRFTTEDGVCLVYNYLFDQWYTFSNYTAVGAVYALDTYCHVKPEGIVNKQVTGQYNDNGRRYSMLLETNWMQFAKLQGFQRIYYWALLGDFISHCRCRVELAYDFENVYNETIWFNTETGLGTDVYGDGVYGEAEVYGGTGSQVFQFRSKPRRQKCEAFKMRISDVDTITESGGGSFALTSMSLEVGLKQGIKKMGSNKTRGNA